MLDHLSAADISHLGNIADQALQTCLTRVGHGRRKLAEVPAVEAVVRVGMRMVARHWRRAGLFPRSGLALQTVFTHAAPKVRFTRPGGGPGLCELSDLLIVIDDPSAMLPEGRRRAVLVQAKLHDPPGRLHLNNGNEQVQFELMSAWPGFTFEAGFYKPHARHLMHGPSDPIWSGEYGGIDQPPPGHWTQYQILHAPFATMPPVSGAVTLGSLLAGMLAGRSGYGRPAIPYARDPWSETVDELLDVTFKRPLRNRQPRSRRGREFQLGFMNFDDVVDGRSFAPHPTAGGEGGIPDHFDELGEWPDGAINVVRFTVGERLRD